MLTQLFNIDRSEHFFLACSAGVDSMAVTDFFRKGGKKFSIAYFDHGTGQSKEMLEYLARYSDRYKIPIVSGNIKEEKSKDESPEEYWRNQRYGWFRTLPGNIVMCHHLNDVAETWLFSSMHGNPKIISSKTDFGSFGRHKIMRPFLLTPKESMIGWCRRNDVSWIEDRSNANVSVPRNRIRHVILQEVLKINPGFLKVMRKKVILANKDS